MTQVDRTNAFPHLHHNINLLWASLFIEELTRHNITDFCIAPGSRSTPLTLAAANHPKVNTHVHFDERGLGFLALGLSQVTLKPVVVITTSGTAVANLYPAVIEARQSQLPLIIISADRPPELINCAANQAIDQHNIFANYPVFFNQLPSPSESIKSNFLLTTINQGLFQQQLNSGPIHFNMAIPEPFYPTNKKTNFQHYLSSLKKWCIAQTPFTTYQQLTSLQLVNSLQQAEEKIDLNAEKILVVVGRIKDKKQASAIQAFCKLNHLPLFADIQSQLQGSKQNIAGYDLLLENEKFKHIIQQATRIIQFSDHLVSKRLNQLIEQTQTPLWEISESNNRIDPMHCVNQRFVCDPQTFTKQTKNTKTTNKQWLEKIKCYQSALPKQLKRYLTNEQLSEINTSHYLLNQTTHNLMIGNSLAIRLADMFAQTNAMIYSNRGASGIDGLIATAIGIAKKSPQPTSLLIGDTSFLYDLNSLALVKQLQLPFVIVLLNNDGGGIFNLLPVPEAQQEQFYQNPHGLTFKQTCEQFSIDYYQPSTFLEFKENYQQANAKKEDNKAALIEVCINNQLTPNQLKTIKDEVRNAIIL